MICNGNKCVKISVISLVLGQILQYFVNILIVLSVLITNWLFAFYNRVFFTDSTRDNKKRNNNKRDTYQYFMHFGWVQKTNTDELEIQNMYI